MNEATSRLRTAVDKLTKVFQDSKSRKLPQYRLYARRAEDKAFIRDVVEPIWDDLRSMLNKRHLLTLITARDGLVQHLESRRTAIEEYRNAAAFFRDVIRYCQEKRAVNLYDSPIGEISTPVEPKHLEGEFLFGEEFYEYGTEESKQVVMSRYDNSTKKYPRGFDQSISILQDKTWRDLRNQAAEEHDVYAKYAASLAPLADLMEFRLYLINLAIYEYEVYGFVGEWKTSARESFEEQEALGQRSYQRATIEKAIIVDRLMRCSDSKSIEEIENLEQLNNQLRKFLGSKYAPPGHRSNVINPLNSVKEYAEYAGMGQGSGDFGTFKLELEKVIPHAEERMRNKTENLCIMLGRWLHNERGIPTEHLWLPLGVDLSKLG